MGKATKAQRRKVWTRAARLIQGHSTTGNWVDGDDFNGGDPNDRGDYERLLDYAERIKAKSPNEVPCQMCTEGALFMACAMEGYDHETARSILEDATHIYMNETGHTSIPGFNDDGVFDSYDGPDDDDEAMTAHMQRTIEGTFQRVAERVANGDL